MTEVNWGYWIKCDAWTLREAILLLEGKEPEGLEPPYSSFFYRTEEIAIRSNRAKKLLSIDGRPLLRSTVEINVQADRPARDLYYDTKNIIAEAAMRNQRILSGYYKNSSAHYQRKEIISSASGSIGIDPRTFLKWSIDKEIKINEYLNEIINDISKEKTDIIDYKDCTIDRHMCKAIASCLWDDNPKRTIKEVIEHPWIKKHGNGAQYHEKTIRKWIHKLDPRPEQERIGRPEKRPSESSEKKPPSDT